jgi:hypothetical protein
VSIGQLLSRVAIGEPKNSSIAIYTNWDAVSRHFFSANFFDMLDQLFIRVLNIFKHHTLHSLPVDTPLPDLRMP